MWPLLITLEMFFWVMLTQTEQEQLLFTVISVNLGKSSKREVAVKNVFLSLKNVLEIASVHDLF